MAPKVIFVLGGPGAGKGTQCEAIVKEFGWVHLSAGDLLRAERNSGSSNGDLINDYIKEGKIVPVEITVELIKTAMQRAMEEDEKEYFLVDGFPRNKDNLDGWERVMGKYAEVLSVLFFDCPETVMEQRLLKRGETSGRVDDNLESIRKRFRTFQESTIPILDYFNKHRKVHRVDTSRNVASITQDIFKYIRTL